MTQNELMRIAFANNLKFYMKINNITQNDIIRDLKIPSATISSWVNAKRLPRIGKIQQLAKYLGINTSDLIGNVVIGSFDQEEDGKAFAEELLKDPHKVFTDTRSFYGTNETALLQHFNKLNPIGKKEAEKRVEELTYIEKYTKKD